MIQKESPYFFNGDNDLQGTYIYLEPKWGPIFWKIQAIKLKDKSPPKRAQLGSRYIYIYLGGGFKYFSFSPLFGEDSHFD